MEGEPSDQLAAHQSIFDSYPGDVEDSMEHNLQCTHDYRADLRQMGLAEEEAELVRVMQEQEAGLE